MAFKLGDEPLVASCKFVKEKMMDLLLKELGDDNVGRHSEFRLRNERISSFRLWDCHKTQAFFAMTHVKEKKLDPVVTRDIWTTGWHLYFPGGWKTLMPSQRPTTDKRKLLDPHQKSMGTTLKAKDNRRVKVTRDLGSMFQGEGEGGGEFHDVFVWIDQTFCKNSREVFIKQKTEMGIFFEKLL